MSNRELELFPCLYLSAVPGMTNRFPSGNKSQQRLKGWKKSLPVQKLFELLIVQSRRQIRGCQGGGLVQTEKNKTTILAGFARTRVKTNNGDKETDEGRTRGDVCCLQTQLTIPDFGRTEYKQRTTRCEQLHGAKQQFWGPCDFRGQTNQQTFTLLLVQHGNRKDTEW